MAGTTETAKGSQLPLSDCTNTRRINESKLPAISNLKSAKTENPNPHTDSTNDNSKTATENTMDYHRQVLKAKLEKGEQ